MVSTLPLGCGVLNSAGVVASPPPASKVVESAGSALAGETPGFRQMPLRVSADPGPSEPAPRSEELPFPRVAELSGD